MKRLKKLSLLHWLLLATFFNGLMFVMIIPMWHGPDEQAHFAQIQYFAEFKQTFPKISKFNSTSQEVLLSERLLGTERDELGKNKFTHRPEYRLEYTNDSNGKYEAVFKNLPRSSRLTLVKNEATRYPPLFYTISAVFYSAVYPLSIIERIFFTRLASVLMGVATVWFAYKIAELIFPKQKLAALTVAMFVSFQPMFSFLSASINSDNLMNLLFTWFLYICVTAIVFQKLTKKTIVALTLVIFAGFLTKPHFVIVLPLVLILPLFLWRGLKSQFKRDKSSLALFGISVAALILFRLGDILTPIFKGQNISFSEISLRSLVNPRKDVGLLEYFIWTTRHTIAEVIPWYWGVFNWLGVVLPRTVNRVINRVMVLASVGVLIWLWKNRQIRKWRSRQKALVFLTASSGIFFLILFLWDWLFIRGSGYSFGMQGRYYFPTIVAHMMLLFLGLVFVLPDRFRKVRSLWIKGWGLSMILLNFIGLHTVTTAYYQLTPLTTFFNQVSQYKPLIFKFPWIILWATLYIITLGKFLVRFISYADNKRSWP